MRKTYNIRDFLQLLEHRPRLRQSKGEGKYIQLLHRFLQLESN